MGAAHVRLGHVCDEESNPQLDELLVPPPKLTFDHALDCIRAAAPGCVPLGLNMSERKAEGPEERGLADEPNRGATRLPQRDELADAVQHGRFRHKDDGPRGVVEADALDHGAEDRADLLHWDHEVEVLLEGPAGRNAGRERRVGPAAGCTLRFGRACSVDGAPLAKGRRLRSAAHRLLLPVGNKAEEGGDFPRQSCGLALGARRTSLPPRRVSGTKVESQVSKLRGASADVASGDARCAASNGSVMLTRLGSRMVSRRQSGHLDSSEGVDAAVSRQLEQKECEHARVTGFSFFSRHTEHRSERTVLLDAALTTVALGGTLTSFTCKLAMSEALKERTRRCMVG